MKGFILFWLGVGIICLSEELMLLIPYALIWNAVDTPVSYNDCDDDNFSID